MLLIASSIITFPTLGAVADVVRGAVMVLFVISALLVTLVVLAQEGKGGGLAGAFGGAGADTFGVKAGTVNKFTAWLAAAFLGLALLYAGLASFTTNSTAAPDVTEYEDTETPNDDIVAPGGGNAEKDPKKGSGPGKGDGSGKGKGNGQGNQNEGAPGDGEQPKDAEQPNDAEQPKDGDK